MTWARLFVLSDLTWILWYCLGGIILITVFKAALIAFDSMCIMGTWQAASSWALKLPDAKITPTET